MDKKSSSPEVLFQQVNIQSTLPKSSSLKNQAAAAQHKASLLIDSPTGDLRWQPNITSWSTSPLPKLSD